MERTTTLVLERAGCRAVFLPEVGMLGSSLAVDGFELLSLHGGVEHVLAGGTNGLPLLAPWANRLSRRRFRAAGVDVDLSGLELGTDENGLPIHGTMIGVRRWTVLDEAPTRARARFDYDEPELLRAFPFPHRLELDVSLGNRVLRVEAALEPLGDRPVPVSFGWHPYFRVPGARDTWRLELPACRRLALDARGIPTGASAPCGEAGAVLPGRDWDDLFALEGGRTVSLESDGTRLEVRYGEGYDYAQIYSPRDSGFVAIEPMTVPTDALTRDACPLVQPGERFAAAFEVAVA